MKVMIVDDNKFDRMMLSKMLVFNKYDAVEAGNGIEALKLISKEKPDIVVSDIMMPEMDGFSLLREIRKSKSAKELPFVFYSASYVNEKDRELANALGVSRFIIKPVEPKDLIKEITQILLDFSNGKLEIIEPTLKDDEYLEQYSCRIFKKLQEKVIQLEQEIDERKRIEEELRKSEAQFRATFEEAPIGMARLDIEGRNLETNHILQQMLGFTGEELKGKVFTEFTHPDDVELDMGQFMELISGKKDHYMIKKRYIRKKGSVFWARMTVSLVRDANGDPQFSISMVEDITERKEAEEKLQKSEEKYRTLIENIQDGVFVIQDGEIQYINEFFSRLAGYEVEEVIGKDFVEFIAPEDRIRIADYYIRWEAGEKVPRENEFNIIHKDKKTRITVNANIGFINYRGKVASMGTLKDITERKRAQEDLRIKAQLLDSASDFIYVQAEKMFKENARAELYGFIVSALPVFASGVPSHVRDFLIKNFSERFEKNVKPRFNEEMKQKSLNGDPKQLLDFFMVWISALFLNFGIENKKKTEGKKRVLEFTNCPWINEARGNPIFCFICRSLAKRSFTWTALNGIVEQKSSIASGSKICRFDILVQGEKLQEA